MFERFSDRARRVVVLAQEEARLLNHNYIGTEHILLGLIHEGEGVAAEALGSLGISLEAVRAQVQEIIGHGGQEPFGHIPFTPRAKKVLEFSLREALQLGHDYIGTEHILLGLIREGEGVGAQVLVKLGADPARVRQEVVRLVSGEGVSTAEFVRGATGTIRAAGIRPAKCGFCGVPSPECGALFTGVSGALICGSCAATASRPSVSMDEAMVMPRRAHTVRVGGITPESIETMAARHEPTGPPPDDEDAARRAIEDAFVHQMEVGADGRTLINVEDGAALAECAKLVRARVGQAAEQAEQVIDHVKFLDATTAVVWVTTLLNGRPPLTALWRRECRAVVVDGRWKVSRESMCEVWSYAGVQCPPRAASE